jgi:hypothetical protein
VPKPDQLDLTPTNILDFAKKYSMYPANQAPEYVPKNETALTGKFAGFRHTLVGRKQRVARITVTKNVSVVGHRATDYLVTPSLSATSGTPAFFLPWDKRGAAVEMTIPPFSAGVGDPVANPPIFFTAVLSGCSIIFKGTQTKPTIYHCGTGGENDNGTPTTGDSNHFFRSMLRNVRDQGLGRDRSVATQVLSTDYMVTKGGTGAAATHQAQFKAKLEKHYKDSMYIESVQMWGIVFGFRTGVNWEFYLQENATIYYRKVNDIIEYFVMEAMQQKTPQSFDLSKLTPAMLTQAGNKIPLVVQSRPAVVTKVFPGGTANVKVTNRWKSLHI